MKGKVAFVCVLFLMVVSLSACSIVPHPPVSSEMQNAENTTTVPTEMLSDPFEAVRASEEAWLSYGLSAYESGKNVENLKDFFSDRANMTYLTLYDHMFVFDKNTSVPIAEALFAFIHNEYGADALLNIEKRCEYKTAYLRSLGLDMEYGQTSEVEAFFATMDFSSDATYKYIISFDNLTYYFKDFSAGSPAQYHGFLYFNTIGLFEMIEYMKSQNLGEWFETDRKFDYYMTFDGSGYSKTVYTTGNMYINESNSALHEAVHAMGITKNDNIWLSEGICNYFGNSLGFNDQIAASYIQMLTMAKQGYFDERAEEGDQTARMYKMLYEQYISAGGEMENTERFDLRLYNDIVARLEYDVFKNATLGEAYVLINKQKCNAIGAELTYAQATSLVTYLVEKCGLKAVLEAYRTQDIAGTLGNPYEELKEEWVTYLKK